MLFVRTSRQLASSWWTNYRARFQTSSRDSSRVVQVLSNLLGNALKFTPRDGSVTLTAEVQANAPDLLRFTVSDTGCGIPDDAVARVFERLYQVGPQKDVSRNGLGLGLHICKEIVQLHGGSIWAESNLSRGKQFSFYATHLPPSPASSRRSPSRTAACKLS